MRKVYIRGVKGHSEEVIAKLVELGGKDEYNINGGNADYIYYINGISEISCVAIDSATGTAIMWAGTEIFLDKHNNLTKLVIEV